MHQKTKDIQKRYEGFLQTNCLWIDDKIYGIQQFQIQSKSCKVDIEINDKIRLGKYIERFVSFELGQEESVEIISENIQIQDDKRTLGELDFIIYKESIPIHLEVVYKFYLYDEKNGNNEIGHFIGPNKKDSLLEKLSKLKEKQLPLLYSQQCSEYLKSINLNNSEIEQQVYFKAQLYVPFSNLNIELKTLNQNCICGFYANIKQMMQFSDSKFFIPSKKDWITMPHQSVNWISFNKFKEISIEFLHRKFSPLVWLKKSNGELGKFFLVWW